MNQKEDILFRFKDVEFVYALRQLKQPFSLEMLKGECWLVYGENGSGKTSLAQAIFGNYTVQSGLREYGFEENFHHIYNASIQYITYQDQFSERFTGTFYQSRWNKGVMSEYSPVVGEDLKIASHFVDPKIIDLLGMSDLFDREIVSLSSGEYRRYQLARFILRNPRLLIVENPYIGLDAANRKQVAQFFELMVKRTDISLILISSRLEEDRNIFSHVVRMADGVPVKLPATKEVFKSLEDMILAPRMFYELPKVGAIPFNNEIISLRNVTVRYDSNVLLRNLTWTVRRGEKWALVGPNGSGKSTLLSLIYADNPQGYACDITLFGRRRGTGESIWDIKKNIGYCSPELYEAYRKPHPVRSILASGLYDTVGIHRRFSQEDYDKVEYWARLFEIEDLLRNDYQAISEGEQRMVLLARAFVKDPDLLILDEPFHGLDDYHRQMSKQIIQAYAERPGKTLIMVSHYEDEFPQCITNKLELSK